MAQLLSRRDMAMLRRAGPRASSSNRSCKLLVTAFKNGSEHESRRKVKLQAKEQTTPQSKEQAEAKQQANDQAKVQFQLPHHVEWGQDVCLVGEADELGAWDVGKCIPMAWHDGDVWTAEAQLPQGAHFEYKYVVREGDGEAKDVVEWQPCMNLEVTADKGELTVRDAWEGQHEVHAGMLPIPVPPPKETEEAQPAADSAAAAALSAAPAPAAAAVPEAPTDEQQQAVGPAATHEAAFATPRVVAASVDVEQPVLTAEEIAAAEVDAAAAAAAPAVLSGSSKAELAAQVLGSGAEEEMAAHIRQPHKGAVTPSWLAEQSPKQMPPTTTSAAAPDTTHTGKSSSSSKAKPKASSSSYADLPTSELKTLCKQRGLSMKGQRAQLLQRLQHRKA